MESAVTRAVRGHITRRGKAWRVHVYLGRDEETGKERYLTRTVRGARREAENVCAALVAQASQGRFAKSAGTMGELLDTPERGSTEALQRLPLDRARHVWRLTRNRSFR